MPIALRSILAACVMAGLLVFVGFYQSWSLSFAIINMCLVSAVMALGVNIQWGYAGLFNVGIMGFAALGGVAAMLVSTQPVTGAWVAGGFDLLLSLLALVATIVAVVFLRRKMDAGRLRSLISFIVIVLGILLVRQFYLPAVDAIEDFEPAHSGFLGGLVCRYCFPGWWVDCLLPEPPGVSAR